MKKNLKQIVSIALVVVLMMSTMAISAVTTSAATEQATYSFEFHTAGSKGTSLNKIEIKVNGDKGSTAWHNVGRVANDETGSASFSDVNVGNMLSISIKNNGINGVYNESIRVKKQWGSESFTTTFYGGRWIDDKKETTLAHTDKVFKITLKTGYCDTNTDVHFTLIDKNGVKSDDINASSIHPDFNAFKSDDLSSFYVQVPDNFGELDKVELRLADRFFADLSIYLMDFWDCEKVEVQQISGDVVGNSFYSKEIDCRIYPELTPENIFLWFINPANSALLLMEPYDYYYIVEF